MADNNRIVFHFLNPELYTQFSQDLSSEKVVILLKNNKKLSQDLFSGYRINKQNFKLPPVQKRLKEKALSNQEIRNFLCRAWLTSKIALITILLESLSFCSKHDPSDLSWVEEIHEFQIKQGLLETADIIIKKLICAETNHNDILIIISILSWKYDDQLYLEKYVSKIIAKYNEAPAEILEELKCRIEADEQVIEDLKKQKKNKEDELIVYKSEIDESIKTHGKKAKIIESAKNELTLQESAKQQKIEDFRNTIARIEEDLTIIRDNLVNHDQKYRKLKNKAEYEQRKISEEISKVNLALNDIEKDITSKKSVLQNKIEIRHKLEKKLETIKKLRSNEIIPIKNLIKTQEPPHSIESKCTMLMISEHLDTIMRTIGSLEPLRKNEINFVATPTSLSIIEALSSNNFNQPTVQPKLMKDQIRVDEHVDYWYYQSVWGANKWNDDTLIKYSLWRSIQLEHNYPETASELALSGIFYSERSHNIEYSRLLLKQFLKIISESGQDEQGDYDELNEKMIFLTLEDWEQKTLVVNYMGQLALVCPEILNYMFEIADKRSRILLKRIMSRSFENFLDIDEYDASHEIIHLINAALEQSEAQLRAACVRWLVQDSVDAIAQNARSNLMAIIAKLPKIGHWRATSISKDFESQVSVFISRAIQRGTPDAFENLAQESFRYASELIRGKTWIGSAYFWPCVIHLTRLALEASTQARRLFRAEIVVGTDKEFYPLTVASAPCPVEIIIRNHGNTEARNIKALFMPSRDSENTEVEDGEPVFSILGVGNEFRHKLQINLKKHAPACSLEYIINWTDSSAIEERSITGALKLLTQKEIDWERVQNPYSLKSIKNPERLKGRSDVMDTLRRSQSSMDSYYITGQRRTGKSSVAQVYYKELNEIQNCVAIYLWWGELGAADLAPICHAICYELAYKVRERAMIADMASPQLIDFVGNENFVFNTYFKKLHERLPEWKIFILIDDFDELPATLHEASDGDRFFILLRALLDKDYVALYLVGSEKLPAILKRQGERLNLNQRCEIDYLKDSNEIEKIIVEPAERILEFNRGAINEIKSLSAGNPYYSTLICSRLFNDMARRKDYYVSKRDVEQSVITMIQEDALSTYQHFWKDGVFLPGRLGERQQYHNAKVLIALSRAEVAEGKTVSKEELAKRDDLHSLNPDDIEYALNTLVERKVVIETNGGMIVRVPLFRKWLAGNGAQAVERSFAETGLDEVPINIARGLSTREIIKVSQDLVYHDNQINEVQIADWLSQFGGRNDQALAFKLLIRLREEGYFNQARMFSAFRELHKQIISMEASEKNFAPRSERKNTVNVVISYLDPSGKSGYACQYAYRRVNHIHSKCVIAPEKLPEFLFQDKKNLPVIFVDDIVGTGGTIDEGFKNLKKVMKDHELEIGNNNFYLAAVVGTKEGCEFVEKETAGAIRIMLWHEVDEKLYAFSDKAGIFSKDSDRIAAMELIQEIGKDLEPKHPLGRNNGQLLIAFQHGCPNNTLPIFYKSGCTFRGREWRPLFPR